jgi:hypothetical protein
MEMHNGILAIVFTKEWALRSIMVRLCVGIDVRPNKETRKLSSTWGSVIWRAKALSAVSAGRITGFETRRGRDTLEARCSSGDKQPNEPAPDNDLDSFVS